MYMTYYAMGTPHFPNGSETLGVKTLKVTWIFF